MRKDEEFKLGEIIGHNEDKVRNDMLRRRVDALLRVLREDLTKKAKPQKGKGSGGQSRKDAAAATSKVFNIKEEASKIIEENMLTIGRLLKAFHNKDKEVRKHAMENYLPALGQAFDAAADKVDSERRAEYLDEMWRKAAISLKKDNKWEKFRDYYLKRSRDGQEEESEGRPAKRKKT